MVNNKLVIDAVVFSEELPILELRLNELDPVVDYFILIESSKTQSGKDKPFIFKENEKMFEKFLPKIISVQLDKFENVGTEKWALEIWQRNNIITGLQKLQEKGIKIKTEDYLCISDVDEIVSAESLKQEIEKSPDLISFNHRFISYYLNMVCNHRGWYGTVLTTFEVFEACRMPNYLRSIKDGLKHPEGYQGWHFSGMGGFKMNWNKWITRVEPENKACLELGKEKMEELWDKCVLKDGYFFYCDQPERRDIKLEKMDFNLLPEHVKENKDRFKNLLMP